METFIFSNLICFKCLWLPDTIGWWQSQWQSVALIAIIIFIIIASSYKYESRYHVLYRIIMLDVDVNKTGLLKLSHPKQGIYGSNQSEVPFTFKET